MKIYIFPVLAYLICGIVSESQLYGQTTFNISSVPPDYSSYEYIEDCMAAVERIDRLPKMQSQIVDTFLVTREVKFQNYPVAAKDTGRICIGKWNTDTLSAKFIGKWSKNLLQVGFSIDSVKALYGKYLASVPPAELQEARRTWLSVVESGLDTSLVPYYLREYKEIWGNIPADSIRLQFLYSMGNVNFLMRVNRYDEASKELDKVGVFMAEYGKDPVFQTQSLLFWTGAAWGSFQLAKEDMLMGRLALSTESYYNALDSMRQLFSPSTDISVLNKKLPSVHGNYWFRKLASGEVDRVPTPPEMPASQTVNIVAFLHGGCQSTTIAQQERVPMRKNANLQFNWRKCINIAATLNRIKHDYPEVEITIVARTFGSFGYGSPLKSAEEAAVIADYFLNYYKIDATIAVEETGYINLPGLDKRRIDLPTENDERFLVSNTPLAKPGQVIISDKEGMIIHIGAIDKFQEIGVSKKIETVLKRKQIVRH